MSESSTEYDGRLTDVMNYPPSGEREGNDKNFEVIGIPAFVAEFNAKASVAQKRALMQTMYLLPSHFSDLLVNSLVKASKRGVEASIVTDGIVKISRARDKATAAILGSNSTREFDVYATKKMDEKLKDSGVKVVESRPFTKLNLLLFAFKRNHFKMAVVDNTAWIGGLNAGKESDFNRIDFMMRVTDQELVDELASIIQAPEKINKDYSKTVGNVDLIVDGGVPGQSIIMEKVNQAIESIEHPEDAEITILSPWVPDGKLLDVLHEAGLKGTKITVVTSYHPFEFAFEGVYALVKNYNILMMNLKGKRLTTLYTPLEVHGKMLFIRDGSKKTAMITTHNFTDKGVKMGTAEIALMSQNETFADSCNTFIEKVKSVSKTTK